MTVSPLCRQAFALATLGMLWGAEADAQVSTTTTSDPGPVITNIPPPEPAEPEPDAAAKPPALIKGNLIRVGNREIVSKYDHAGVRLGPSIISKDLYLSVTPNIGMYWEKFSLGFQIPLNMLLVEGATQEFGGMKIRSQDWDEVSDFAKVIRFITYGKKEDPLFFTIDSLRTVTMGHGEMVNRYQGSIDIDRILTGVELDAYNDFGGFQLAFNDITARGQILSGLAFVKPLGWMEKENWFARSLSFGIEYAADFKAPRCIQASVDDPTCVRAAGNQAGLDPITGLERDATFIRTDPDTGRPVTLDTTVHALGFSGEFRVLDGERANLKAYGTFHQFFDQGGGFASGLLGRATMGQSVLHALRVRGEFRTFNYNYLPGYFDTLYEVNKYQYAQGSTNWQVTPTKYQAAFGDPENGFVIEDTTQRYGFNFDLNWGVYADNRSDQVFGFGVGLQDSDAPDSANFYVHTEFTLFKYFQFFGSFIRANMVDLGGIFDTDQSDNIVVLSGARLQILPIMFVNAYYQKQFQIVGTSGTEFHLGNDLIVDETGAPSPFFVEDRVYENVSKFMVELEIGLEWKD